jgi:hypothetical protein
MGAITEEDIALAERNDKPKHCHDIWQKDSTQVPSGQCLDLHRGMRSIPLSCSKMTPDAANCYSGRPSRAVSGQTITHSGRPDSTCRVYSAETTTFPNYHSRNATKKPDFKLVFLFVCIPTGHMPMAPLVAQEPPPLRNALANFVVLGCILYPVG